MLIWRKGLTVLCQIYFQNSLAYMRVCTLICTHTVRTRLRFIVTNQLQGEKSLANSMTWGQFLKTILNMATMIQLGIKVFWLRRQRLFSVLLSYTPKCLSHWGYIGAQGIHDSWSVKNEKSTLQLVVLRHCTTTLGSWSRAIAFPFSSNAIHGGGIFVSLSGFYDEVLLILGVRWVTRRCRYSGLTIGVTRL